MADDTSTDTGVERDRRILTEAKQKGGLATLGAYVRLSGPGWLQSAITLGGGSLSSSLYLGVLAGCSLLWLQPLAMIIGIIMLSAIGYVTLSTGERPFQAINKHVNPVLGWGWILATLLANCVWSMPQFNLAWGSISQNLMPDVFSGMHTGELYLAKWIVTGGIALLCIIIVFCYDGGGAAVKFFNILLKLMVAVIVVSFLGVVVYMSAKGELNWGTIGNGIVPDFRMLWTPASTFGASLRDVGPAGDMFRTFWEAKIVDEQQDVLIAAAATAVGINMTFLLPYSMLKRGWNKQFRGLAVFDLSTGLFIPFILATGCVVIAAASQFHTQPAVPFAGEEAAIAIAKSSTPEQVQKLLTKHYGHWLTDEAKENFATAETAAKVFAVKDDPAELAKALEVASAGKTRKADKKLSGGYTKIALTRVKKGLGAEYDKTLAAKTQELGDEGKAKAALVAGLPLADRKIAAMLVRRDSIHLARALSPLTGDVVANYVFGIGVVGMAVSSIIILMLINGFTVCEMVDRPSHGWLYRFGCMIPAVGIAGPFIWSGAAPYLAIPTSVFGFIVIPIAYSAFAMVLNQKKLLGDNMPKGLGRWIWNLFMLVGVLAVAIGSAYMAWKSTRNLPGIFGGGWVGPTGIGVFVGLVLVVDEVRARKAGRVGVVLSIIHRIPRLIGLAVMTTGITLAILFYILIGHRGYPASLLKTCGIWTGVALLGAILTWCKPRDQK